MDQPGSEDNILNLCRIRDQLKQHLSEVQRVLATSEEVTPIIDQEDKLIETKELEKEIEFAKVAHQNKTLTLQRIQLGHSLRTNLEERGVDSALTLNTMKHTLDLCSSILQSQQRCRDLEETLIQTKKNRLALKETGEAMMSKIKTMQKEQQEDLENLESKELKRLQRVLEQEVELTTLVQNVFQNIILGSRINWAEDRQLRDIVLKLEMNADSIAKT
ncbi:centromere protein H isoform X2 [Pleurodeles waltl]|uniref:centromere protein H isoform X2 n=1 Tax=Pleurodeles waltl TaxID=8319 RepID=UPI0037098E0C